jgi:hypothetical protein
MSLKTNLLFFFRVENISNGHMQEKSIRCRRIQIKLTVLFASNLYSKYVYESVSVSITRYCHYHLPRSPPISILTIIDARKSIDLLFNRKSQAVLLSLYRQQEISSMNIIAF